MESLNYRHELKFLCSEVQLYLIENRIRHICKPDPHCGASGMYDIRSLYFDTYDDACYLENKMGVDNRKKYRLRLYNGDTDLIKLECKYAVRNRKAKEACVITEEQCRCLMRGGHVKAYEGQELLERFLLEKRLELLTPKVIVEYVRAPYIYEAGNVRVTFDRKIRSAAEINGFLSGSMTRRSILPENTHIMEVKYDELLPAAISDMISGGQQLRRISFSKYGLCREYNAG